jgi:hypothetical protein
MVLSDVYDCSENHWTKGNMVTSKINLTGACVGMSREEKQQLGAPLRIGEACGFHSFRANNYKLHFFESPSGLKVSGNPSIGSWVGGVPMHGRHMPLVSCTSQLTCQCVWMQGKCPRAREVCTSLCSLLELHYVMSCLSCCLMGWGWGRCRLS